LTIAADRPVPWWVRGVLWIAAAQALLLLLALVQPSAVSLLVPWPASPLNARFIASLYVALGCGVLLASLAPTFRQVRIVLVGVAVATTLLLILTVLRMSTHPGEIARFPLFWLLFYVVDPLLVGLVFWRLGWGGGEASGGGSLTALWLVQAVLFGATGAVLLLAPSLARSLWPWAITEPQAQLYSAFFLTIAVTGLLAAREPRWDGVRWLAFMVALLGVLVLAVSLLHLPRFTRGAETVVWLAIFAAEAAVFGGLFVRHAVARS